MALTSRMVHELHCDAPGCGNQVSGPNANDVIDFAFREQNWSMRRMSTSPGRVDIVYFCGLHGEAA
jgi:hypothetical protein